MLGGRGSSSNGKKTRNKITILATVKDMDTKKLYEGENGGYSDSRYELHNKIIRGIVRESEKTRSNRTPRVDIVLGENYTTSSFSHSALKADLQGKRSKLKMLEVSSREIAKRLPEYKKLINKGLSEDAAYKKVRREVNDLYARAVSRLSWNNDRRNFSIRSDFSNPQTAYKIASNLKKNGYSVHVHYIQGSSNMAKSSVPIFKKYSDSFTYYEHDIHFNTFKPTTSTGDRKRGLRTNRIQKAGKRKTKEEYRQEAMDLFVERFFRDL